MPDTTIILIAFATFGVSIIATEKDGLFNVLAWARKKLGGFECSVCLSVWVAGALSLIYGLTFLEYLAVIGINVMLIKVYDYLF